MRGGIMVQHISPTDTNLLVARPERESIRHLHHDMIKAALFCLGNLSALWIAARWAAGISTRRMDFVVGWVALFTLCAVFTTALGGLTAQLHAARLIPALAIVAAMLLVKSSARWRQSSTDGSWKWHPSVATRFAAAATITFASIPLLRAITQGTGYFIDDFGYHTVAVASWVEHGDFRQIMPQFLAYLPTNAELLSGWFALPYHDDRMVALAGLVWLTLAAISAGGLARLLGADITACLLISAAVLASPPILWQTRTFSACDLAGSASLLAAAYFAASATRTQRLGQVIIAGLLAGLAAGTKATFLPVSLLLCLFPLCTSLPRRTRVSFTAAMCGAAALLGSFWYVRNWIVTGNPLFPAQVGPFAGPLTRAEQADIKLSGLIAIVPWTPRLWIWMVHDFLDWPLPLGLLSLAGYTRAILLEWTLPTEETDGKALRRLLFACGAVQFILHFFAPFCLGGGYVGGRIEVFARYVMPWFLFGLALAAPMLSARTRSFLLWRALAVVGLAWSLSAHDASRFCFAAVALIALAAVFWLPNSAWRPLAWAGLIAIWPILALLGMRMREEATHRLIDGEGVRGKSDRSLLAAILALESLPSGTHLTRFANQDYFNAPLYGRSWQWEPIYTTGDGLPRAPLHLQFRTNPGTTFFSVPQRAFPSPKQFLQNLRTTGITDVFVTKFDTEKWPPQQHLLEESGEATATFSDAESTLWHLAPPTGR